MLLCLQEQADKALKQVKRCYYPEIHV